MRNNRHKDNSYGRSYRSTRRKTRGRGNRKIERRPNRLIDNRRILSHLQPNPPLQIRKNTQKVEKKLIQIKKKPEKKEESLNDLKKRFLMRKKMAEEKRKLEKIEKEKKIEAEKIRKEKWKQKLELEKQEEENKKKLMIETKSASNDKNLPIEKKIKADVGCNKNNEIAKNLEIVQNKPNTDSLIKENKLIKNDNNDLQKVENTSTFLTPNQNKKIDNKGTEIPERIPKDFKKKADSNEVKKEKESETQKNIPKILEKEIKEIKLEKRESLDPEKVKLENKKYFQNLKKEISKMKSFDLNSLNIKKKFSRKYFNQQKIFNLRVRKIYIITFIFYLQIILKYLDLILVSFSSNHDS